MASSYSFCCRNAVTARPAVSSFNRIKKFAVSYPLVFQLCASVANLRVQRRRGSSVRAQGRVRCARTPYCSSYTAVPLTFFPDESVRVCLRVTIAAESPSTKGKKCGITPSEGARRHAPNAKTRVAG
jgi:hypothetical protein